MAEVIPASGDDWREIERRASSPEGHIERALLEILQRLVPVENQVVPVGAAGADRVPDAGKLPTAMEISQEWLATYREDEARYDLVAFAHAILAKWGNRPAPAPAAAPAGETNHQWLGGIAVPNEDGWMITQVQPPVPAPGDGGGLTVEQLAECLPGNAWQNSPEGYSRRAFARHLLAHPITGPRLRAAAPGADHVPTAGKMVTPAPTAAPAGGVTEEELAEAMEEACALRTLDAARYLLADPRIGPLLRGEGGKRVVLAEEPPAPREPGPSDFHFVWPGYRDGWAAAHAEVARQQGEGS